MVAVKDLAEVVGVVSACDALAIPRATYYRWLRPKAEPKRRPTPPRALRPKERRVVRELLNSEEFVDQAPAQVYASLLDRGTSWGQDIRRPSRRQAYTVATAAGFRLESAAVASRYWQLSNS